MTTCLIAGASRGIGLELARLYADDGVDVIATARAPAAATALERLAATRKNVSIHALDVADGASIKRLADAIAGKPIDVLIANAGVMGPRGGSADPANTPELWASVLATNATGVFFTVRAFAANVAAARGKVAIISSRMASSRAASGSSFLYRASKAAAANLGANFAVEFKPQGVAVGVYHPGWVKTDMGGPGADISVAESARGLQQRFVALSLSTTGVFEDYAGAAIAY